MLQLHLAGIFQYGHHRQNLRRINTTEILSAIQLSSFLDIRREEVRLLVKGLSLVVLERSIERVDMQTRLQDLTFNITLRMISGKWHFGAAEAKMFKETVREIFELAIMVDTSDLMPALRWLNLSSKVWRMSVHERANGIFHGPVDKHRKKRSKHGDQKTMICCRCKILSPSTTRTTLSRVRFWYETTSS